METLDYDEVCEQYTLNAKCRKNCGLCTLSIYAFLNRCKVKNSSTTNPKQELLFEIIQFVMDNFFQTFLKEIVLQLINNEVAKIKNYDFVAKMCCYNYEIFNQSINFIFYHPVKLDSNNKDANQQYSNLNNRNFLNNSNTFSIYDVYICTCVFAYRCGMSYLTQNLPSI
eukprot:TRINITY_DN44831_c0_g1_i1.p1 TRINITY_DN44831_c0_g1~~TRINITY_DN44831_c0_g1_i1.p1  ORF type:complete len:169 (-),score=0.10 TRINITY_DN44831_c0_g1_i1:37-543(-)